MAQGTSWSGPLRSIRIQNFRRFADLTIPRLGLVNLLVGRNNTGKSSVLEAVRLLVSDGSAEVFRDICVRRDEGFADRSATDLSALLCLCRRGCLPPSSFRVSDGEQFIKGEAVLFHKLESNGYRAVPVSEGENADFAELGFQISTPRGQRIDQSNGARRLPRYGGLTHDLSEPGCVFVGAGGVSRRDIATLWSGVALTEMENRINRCMGESFPEIERISVVPSDGESAIVAKVRGSDRPVSLKSTGEGASRLFGLALAVANARRNVLLIDEVEIGIHYSVQISLWRLLVQMALDFQVQIFATTHSEDAIRAFSIATKENEAVEGRLIRLQSRGGEIEAVDFDEEELWDVRDTGMEVR